MPFNISCVKILSEYIIKSFRYAVLSLCVSGVECGSQRVDTAASSSITTRGNAIHGADREGRKKQGF